MAPSLLDDDLVLGDCDSDDEAMGPSSDPNEKMQMVRDNELVGGLEHEFYDCSIYWEFHNPNCHIFQRGRVKTTTQVNKG